MPIRFAVKTVRLKVYMTIASPMTLTFIQGNKYVSNLTTFELSISRTSKLGMTVIIDTIICPCSFRWPWPSLMQGDSGSAKANIQCWIISTAKQATSVKFTTTIGHFSLRDLDFENVYRAGPTCLGFGGREEGGEGHRSFYAEIIFTTSILWDPLSKPITWPWLCKGL